LLNNLKFYKFQAMTATYSSHRFFYGSVPDMGNSCTEIFSAAIPHGFLHTAINNG
jgi:hypothetical protein